MSRTARRWLALGFSTLAAIDASAILLANHYGLERELYVCEVLAPLVMTLMGLQFYFERSAIPVSEATRVVRRVYAVVCGMLFLLSIVASMAGVFLVE